MTVVAFPAAVTLPDGTYHRPAKVYNDGGTLRVFHADDCRCTEPPRRPAEAWAGTGSQPERLGPRAVKIGTPEGDLLVESTGGCGCGHALKRHAL